MFLAVFGTIPGFVDHGDGTWSITPPRRPRHTSLSDKRRAARRAREAARSPVPLVESASLTRFPDGSTLFTMSGR